MKTYDLYSMSAANLEVARVAFEQALGLTMRLHESSYYGGDYYRFGDVGDEHFVLQTNIDLVDRETIESDVSAAAILLYVNETLRAEEIERMLQQTKSGVVLVRREVL